MITINAHTYLSELFREHPAALETVIGIIPFPDAGHAFSRPRRLVSCKTIYER